MCRATAARVMLPISTTRTKKRNCLNSTARTSLPGMAERGIGADMDIDCRVEQALFRKPGPILPHSPQITAARNPWP